MEGSRLTDTQIKLFCRMLFEVFLEMRSLSWMGSSEQAAALADAFHNLPLYIVSPDFDWNTTRMFIEIYQKKYPHVIQDNQVSGSYNDYLSMLEDIRNA